MRKQISTEKMIHNIFCRSLSCDFFSGIDMDRARQISVAHTLYPGGCVCRGSGGEGSSVHCIEPMKLITDSK